MQNLPYTYDIIIKNLKKDRSRFTKLHCAILADCASQHLTKALMGAAFDHSIELICWESDYDSIETTILNDTSPLYLKKFDYILIFQSHFKLYRQYSVCGNKKNFAEEKLSYINNIVSIIEAKTQSKIILANYAETDDAVYGNYSNKIPQSFLYQVRKLNFELMNLAFKTGNVFILDVQSRVNLVGRANSFDAKLFIHADLVFDLNFLALLAQHTLQIITSVRGNMKKCVILDLDNTIWGGIIGDDGIENIEIDDVGLGKAFRNFQIWLRNLKNRGIILAVCSKNTEAVAREAFEKHPGMILKLEDIAVFSANWETKVDNILFIQSILNIGFDSIVFLDDNPFERAMVRENIAGITVPDLPEDPADYLEYLQYLNLFETASVSEEDTQRTQQYQEEAGRTILKKNFTSETDFLQSLEMVATVKPFDAFTLPRVAQLSHRSNQFNLRTIRYTDQDISDIMNDPEKYTLCVSLKDRFGDYGLISAVILEKRSDTELFINTWIMSCRVLKRGVENFLLNQIADLAKNIGVTKIYGEYIPTAKNGLVKNFYKELGFYQLNGGEWELDVCHYKHIYSFISKNNDVCYPAKRF